MRFGGAGRKGSTFGGEKGQHEVRGGAKDGAPRIE